MKKFIVIVLATFATLALAKVPVTVMPGVIGVELPSMTYLMSDSECPVPADARAAIEKITKDIIQDLGYAEKEGRFSCLFASSDSGLFVTSLKLKLKRAKYELFYENAQNFEADNATAAMLIQGWVKDKNDERSLIILGYFMADGVDGIALYAYTGTGSK